jgi:hypothetical protein
MMSKKSEQGYSVDCYINKVVNVVLNAKCYMASEGGVEVDIGSGMLVDDEGIGEPSVFLNVRLGSFGSMLVFLKEEDAERLILALQEAIEDLRQMKLRESLCEGVGNLLGYYNTILEALLAERYAIGKVLVKRYLDDYCLVEVYDRDGNRMWAWMVWGQFWRYFDDGVKVHLEEAGVRVELDMPEVDDG